MPTDTLYGIVASALRPEAVERLYQVKSRMPAKPPIILIASIDNLSLFGVVPTDAQRAMLPRWWPGPVSIILPCSNPAFDYLHRGVGSLAFRLPDKLDLQTLLAESGPLIAPSANPEGLPPATTIVEARNYFGDAVDFYIDGGVLEGRASTIIRLGADGAVEIVRK